MFRLSDNKIWSIRPRSASDKRCRKPWVRRPSNHKNRLLPKIPAASSGAYLRSITKSCCFLIFSAIKRAHLTAMLTINTVGKAFLSLAIHKVLARVKSNSIVRRMKTESNSDGRIEFRCSIVDKARIPRAATTLKTAAGTVVDVFKVLIWQNSASNTT